jgi:transcriptional regulator with XRE-family HTH domain
MLVAMLDKEIKKRGLSVREAAKQIGVSHTTIFRVLAGTPIDVDTLVAIANWLNVRPSALLNSMSEATPLPELITALVERNPKLEQVLRNATNAIKNGQADPAIIEDIVAYAFYKLNIADEGQYAEQKRNKTAKAGRVSA